MPKVKAINTDLSKETIIYLAGLFDGEGMVAINEQNNKRGKTISPCWQYRVEIANTDWRIMQFLLTNIGGTVSKKSSTRSHWRQGYDWTLTGENADAFCKMIRPFTIIKSDQIDACLYFRQRFARTNKKQTDAEIAAKRMMVETIKMMKRSDYAPC